MTTSHGSRHRPYKVWSCDRQTRKAIVASSLRELKEKGCEKLGYLQQLQEGNCLRLVLESDGTEVEEDTYFQMVAPDTIFLLLRPSEKWLPPGVEALRAGFCHSAVGKKSIP